MQFFLHGKHTVYCHPRPKSNRGTIPHLPHPHHQPARPTRFGAQRCAACPFRKDASSLGKQPRLTPSPPPPMERSGGAGLQARLLPATGHRSELRFTTDRVSFQPRQEPRAAGRPQCETPAESGWVCLAGFFRRPRTGVSPKCDPGVSACPPSLPPSSKSSPLLPLKAGLLRPGGEGRWGQLRRDGPLRRAFAGRPGPLADAPRKHRDRHGPPERH